MSDIILQKIQAKIYANKWCVNDKDVKIWCSLVHNILSIYPVESYLFQLEEIIHYAVDKDIHNGIIGANRDNEHTKKMYIENFTEFEENASKLASPEDTFGEDMGGAICFHCKSKNTLVVAEQRRSCDEPTDYFTHCIDCGKVSKS
jgi:DNA-directed RNA polymerase subunit M/transcription elongation factor TFIIS